MWRLGLLVLASCSMIPLAAEASPAGVHPVARPAEPGPAHPPDGYDKLPAKAPKTLSVPDAQAPALFPSKGPYSQRGSHVGGINVFLPVSQEPANPWAGVSKGHPVKLDIASELWWIRDESIECTAARDHCLPAHAWFWIQTKIDPSPLRLAYPVVFTAQGPKRPAPLQNGDAPPFAAYRSVPATKKNLVPGARAFGVPGAALPGGTNAVYDHWQMGIVERVDWELGMLFFKAMEQPFFITAARVAVISYEGDKLTILDGKKRDELAVKTADLVLP